MLDVSIVIPLLNENESLPELEAWIVKNKTSFSVTFQTTDSTSD